MAGPLNADTFRVERSTVIDAPASAIFPHIDDFHAWEAWSPYETMDADLGKTYAGPTRGVGAAYAWVGKKAGSGSMQITQSTPSSKVVIKLEFTKPFVAHPLIDGRIGGHLECMRLAIDHQFHGRPIPRRQHALLPLEGALLVDEAKQHFLRRYRARWRQDALFGDE